MYKSFTPNQSANHDLGFIIPTDEEHESITVKIRSSTVNKHTKSKSLALRNETSAWKVKQLLFKRDESDLI